MKREPDTPPRLSTPSLLLVRPRPLRTAQGNPGPARRGLTPSSPERWWELEEEEGEGVIHRTGTARCLFFSSECPA